MSEIRFSLNVSAVLVAVLLLLALLLPKVAYCSATRTVDYLYIDAGEGDSSGGHAAIRFGADTFHFQYFDGGLLRAVREDSAHVEFKYRFLGNRTVYVSPIEVDEETYQLLRDRFNHRFLLQNQQFALLDSVKADLGLIESLLGFYDGKPDSQNPNNIVVEIRAAGLFLTDNVGKSDAIAEESPVLRRLVARMADLYGVEYLAQKQASVERAIRRLKPTEWDLSQVNLAEDKFPTGAYSFASRYRDLQTMRVALEVLRLGRSLRPEAEVRLESAEFQLDQTQLLQFKRYARKLSDEILALVESERPDWGFPLLVAMARLNAIERSIQTGQLVFVDTFDREAKRVDSRDLDRYQAAFQSLLGEARADFLAQKAKLYSMPVIDEFAYARFESAANLYAELSLGLQKGRPIRIFDGNLMPVRQARLFSSSMPRLDSVELQLASANASAFQVAYSSSVAGLYPYDLLSRNCVSEIFRVIDSAFADSINRDAVASPSGNALTIGVRTESKHRLGGYVDAKLVNAIPYVSAERVNSAYRVGVERELPSYRKMMLQQIYRKNNGLLTYLKESNTLTSSLYTRNPDDSLFIFFTDDAVVPRPLYGSVNLLAGLAQSLAGVFLSPLDGGQTLLNGVKGFSMSLPELVFFNMRKGSYRFQPYHRLMSPHRVASGE